VCKWVLGRNQEEEEKENNTYAIGKAKKTCSDFAQEPRLEDPSKLDIAVQYGRGGLWETAMGLLRTGQAAGIVP